jgi:hypothetical protein
LLREAINILRTHFNVQPFVVTDATGDKEEH